MKTYFTLILFFTQWCYVSLNAQNLSPDQLRFLQENAVNLVSTEINTSYNFAEIDKSIGDKRFVLIGEFSHGSNEVFEIRNKLIKHLHANLGFDVILFETGIGELIYADTKKEALSPEQMTYGLFGPWRKKAFRDLMEYVKKESIPIAGFDVQRTAGSFKHLLSEVAQSAKLDTLSYNNLEQRFGKTRKHLVNRKIAFSDSLNIETDQLIKDYQFLYSRLLNSANALSIQQNLFTLKTVQNRIGFLAYMLDFKVNKDWNKRWADRDSLMSDNVVWLSENIYPDKKIIIIGHNFHIAKYNEQEKVMGAFLSKKFPNDLHSIGVYAKSGKYLDNYNNEKEISPPDEEHLDIKHIIAATKLETSYLSIPKEHLKGTEWLHQKITTNDTFVNLSNGNTTILSKNYDAVLLLQKVSPPQE